MRLLGAGLLCLLQIIEFIRGYKVSNEPQMLNGIDTFIALSTLELPTANLLLKIRPLTD